jgi:hypothetical protein
VYRRIGDLVHFWLSWVNDHTAAMQGANVRFTLPFHPADIWQPATVGYANGMAGLTAADGAYPVMAYTDQGVSGGALRLVYQNDLGQTIPFNGAILSPSCHVIISGTYITDAP